MKKSDILRELERKFDYLPRREVERTLEKILQFFSSNLAKGCLLYTSPSPRDRQKSRMPSSA